MNELGTPLSEILETKALEWFDKKEGYNKAVYETGALRALLLFNPIYCQTPTPKDELQNYMAHFEFYALTEGWEKFTETGYKSHFFAIDNKDYLSSKAELQGWFDEFLEANKFVAPAAIQTSLF